MKSARGFGAECINLAFLLFYSQALEPSINVSINLAAVVFTGKPAEATGAAASSGDEDDFLNVIAPELPDDEGQNDGFVNKIKKWCSWLYYYIAIAVDKVINLLNDISKDYREIADQLKKERKEKRIEKLRRAKFGYTSARLRHEDVSDPDADAKVCVSDYNFAIPYHS